MDKVETGNLSGGQPEARKNRKPVIAAIVGAVVLVLAIAGLNLAGFISLPFLPKSPEIVLLRALSDVAHDGSFDVAANADTDTELSIEVLGQEATSNVRLTATASGMACDFDANDLSKLTIPDGSFAGDFTFALDVGFLEGETGVLRTAGEFDLALGEGELNYHLQEPIDFKGTVQFDTNALLVEKDKSIKRSVSLSDIHDMKMEGDVVTFTLSTASIDASAVPEMLKELMQLADIDMVDEQMNLSDLDVSVDLSTKGSVRAHVTGTMDMTAQGRKMIDLPSVLPDQPIDIYLKLNVPIDIELTLS